MDKVLLAYSDKFYNVLSGENCEEIYNGIDYDELEKNFVEYDPNDILEGEQWFLVDLNKKNELLNEDKKINNPMNNISSTTSLDSIDKKQYKDIKYVVLKDIKKDWCLIQKMYSDYKIYCKTVSLSNQPTLDNGPSIVLKNEPDAIVDCKNNKLYFKDLNKISTIFHNIFYLYKEANNKEIKEFFDVKLEKIAILKFDISKVSKANRKKLGLSLDNNFIGKEKKYSECIDEFKIDLEIKDSIVQINSNDDLRIFLDVLDENYFHSYVSKENRLARKTRKIL